MPRILTGLLCLLIAGYMGFSVVGAETEGELCVPLGIIELQAPPAVEALRTPVRFPHSLHFNQACGDCHHKWNGDDQLVGCTASGCHDLAQSPAVAVKDGTPSTEGIKYYKNAYHGLCIGCHKDFKIKNRQKELSYQLLGDKMARTGPTGCVGCHPKQAK